DFEDYTDFPPDRIFDTWIDGWDIPTNGATVCYAEPDFLQGGHFVETTIVHTGLQSMPYLYDNSAGYSEAALPLSYPYDWTIQGVELLSLWFHGDPTNASERMYVAIANSRQTPAVVYHDNPDIVGFGDKYNPQAGGSGLVFFDDIRLYRPAELQTDPGYN
ncbi:MAG: hypothetical protein ACYS3S_18005, partial [Planctomycetota bacterium]